MIAYLRTTTVYTYKYAPLISLQCWSDNMGKKGTPKITPFESGNDFTEITFTPDLAKFKMSCLDRDTMALLTRRAYDVAGCLRGVKVFLNGKKLPVSIVEQG